MGKVTKRTTLFAVGSCIFGMVAVTCLALGHRLQAQTSSSAGQVQLLPAGPLESTSQDEAAQKEALNRLVADRAQLENDQSQGDANLSLVSTASISFWDALDAEVARLKSAGREITEPSRESVVGPTDNNIRWVFAPGKVRYEEKQATPDYVIGIYDGTVSHIYQPEKKAARIAPGMEAPLAEEVVASWLTGTTVAKKPISELLKTAGARVAGRQTIVDTPCEKVSVPFGRGLLEIWLSPDNGYRAKRIAHTSGEMPDGGRSYSVNEMNGFQQYDGQWFPTEGAYSRFHLDQNGNREWMESIQWKTVSYAPKAADSLFVLEFPTGTRVSDLVSRLYYTVDGDAAPQ